jgi:hypothetical protein
MKILDGSRPVKEVELHLTDAEAKQLIEEVTALRHDLSDVGMDESHARITADDRDAEVMVYVYASDFVLEAEVTERMRESG